MKKTDEKFITRFAPSPTGLLHLGHGFSALFTHQQAQENNGTMLLRIEDIDQTRCKPEHTQAIYDDLHWLGITWPEPVRVQSEHFADYEQALVQLEEMGLLYPCFCTRADIKKEIANSPSAPHGFDGIVYPQICTGLNIATATAKIAEGVPFALRLNMEKAISLLKEQQNWPLYWHDELQGKIKATPQVMGDIILARKDTPTSYHLSVTVDDHLQQVSHVIRGQDLFEATHIHRLLQALLGFNTPQYHHHKLITDDDGNRLAKRKKSASMQSLRESGEDGLELAQKLMLKT